MTDTIKIDFAIIGAQKSATTTVWDVLTQHPLVFAPSRKEDNFFCLDEIHEMGQEHLRLVYPDVPADKLLAHAHVNNMYYAEKTAPRMQAHNPKMKLIAVLRNPVDRAYSAFWYARARGWESHESFEAALEVEYKGDIAPEFPKKSHLTYLAHGHYATQLQKFIDIFGRDKLLVLFQQDIAEMPVQTYVRIFNFLGLPMPEGLDFKKVSNRAFKARSQTMANFIVNDSLVKKLYKSLVPYRWRYRVSSTLVARMQAFNRKETEYPPMREETRAMLNAYYAPLEAHLLDIAGRNFGLETTASSENSHGA